MPAFVKVAAVAIACRFVVYGLAVTRVDELQLPAGAGAATIADAMRLLFVVEEAFEASRIGVVLGPPLPAETKRGIAFEVELRRPNGERKRAHALPMRWPERPGFQLTVLDLRLADVPVGTEVWTAE